uniref:Uncharacterized protein n=1 Tax=Oryza barthii TaxID=65489 RepID=A0A0D3HCB5_9ORYZ
MGGGRRRAARAARQDGAAGAGAVAGAEEHATVGRRPWPRLVPVERHPLDEVGVGEHERICHITNDGLCHGLGKINLVGEHATFHSLATVAAAINLYTSCYLHLLPLNDNEAGIAPLELDIKNPRLTFS